MNIHFNAKIIFVISTAVLIHLSIAVGLTKSHSKEKKIYRFSVYCLEYININILAVASPPAYPITPRLNHFQDPRMLRLVTLAI